MLRANFCVVLFPKSLYSYIDTRWRRSSSRKKFQTASASTLPKFIWNIRDNDLKIARKVLLEELLENRESFKNSILCNLFKLFEILSKLVLKIFFISDSLGEQ